MLLRESPQIRFTMKALGACSILSGSVSFPKTAFGSPRRLLSRVVLSAGSGPFLLWKPSLSLLSDCRWPGRYCRIFINSLGGLCEVSFLLPLHPPLPQKADPSSAHRSRNLPSWYKSLILNMLPWSATEEKDSFDGLTGTNQDNFLNCK